MWVQRRGREGYTGCSPRLIVNGEVGNYDVVSFLDYCRMRRCVEANDFAALRVVDLQRYRGLKVRFLTVAFDALYRRWRDAPDVPVSFADVYTAARRDCVLRVHALGDRYELARRTKEAQRR